MARKQANGAHDGESLEASRSMPCWPDGWRTPQQAAGIGPDMLLMQLEHPRSCIYLGFEHASIFPRLPSDADALGECGDPYTRDDAKIDIALLPASASFPAVSGGAAGADGEAFGSQRAIGANATCVTYAVKPGVVRVVCVLDQGAQQNAPLYRVSRGPPARALLSVFGFQDSIPV